MSFKKLLVRDFISEAIIVDPLTPISKVIGLMRENNAYEVFIDLKDRIGVVTIRNMLRAKSFTNVRIESFMSFTPKLSLDMDLMYAARIMADYRLRALPVAGDRGIIGKLDAKTIIDKIRNSSLNSVKISKTMSTHPLTIASGEKIAKAREIMLRKKFDQIPVVKDKRVEGVVTSASIVFNLIPVLGGEKYTIGSPDTIRSIDSPVNTIMDINPLKCSPQDTIREVISSMLSLNSSYCLVILGEELHGIVTYRDFMNLISEKIETNIPVYILGLPDDPFEAEATKIKFMRIIDKLNRILPLTEARSIIKTVNVDGLRRRYEVDVTIKSPGKNYNFSLGGWNLPAIYDDLTNIIKKTIASRKKRREVPKEYQQSIT
ncbi:MAG: CBS domain-containing protein [Candidatus Methanomethylicia archaeon]